MQDADFVRILGHGQFHDPDLCGQVGRIVAAFRDCWVVETRPNAYFGSRPDYWDNFTETELAPATGQDLADYLVQQLVD